MTHDDPFKIFVQDSHMDAIEGCISQLAALNSHPRGYAFKSITIYCVPPFDTLLWFLQRSNPSLFYLQGSQIIIKTGNSEDISSASQVKITRTLDFKKAGPIVKDKVNEVKKLLQTYAFKINDNGDYEFDNGIILPVDCVNCKTELISKNSKIIGTANGLYLIEVDDSENEDHWRAISFKKMIKKYLTEDLGLNITNTIFGGPGDMLPLEKGEKAYQHDKKYAPRNSQAYDLVARINLTIVNCKESLYQSLEQYGKQEFNDVPINLFLRGRTWCFENKDITNQVKLMFNDEEVSILLDIEYAIPDKERREFLKKEFMDRYAKE